MLIAMGGLILKASSVLSMHIRVSLLCLLGELWALPIMFRLALIENLRRVADIISENKRDRDSANYWVDRMTDVAKEDPKSLILVIADMARSDPPLTSAFVAEMARKLQGSSRSLLFPTFMDRAETFGKKSDYRAE